MNHDSLSPSVVDPTDEDCGVDIDSSCPFTQEVAYLPRTLVFSPLRCNLIEHMPLGNHSDAISVAEVCPSNDHSDAISVAEVCPSNDHSDAISVAEVCPSNDHSDAISVAEVYPRDLEIAVMTSAVDRRNSRVSISFSEIIRDRSVMKTNILDLTIFSAACLFFSLVVFLCALGDRYCLIPAGCLLVIGIACSVVVVAY